MQVGSRNCDLLISHVQAILDHKDLPGLAREVRKGQNLTQNATHEKKKNNAKLLALDPEPSACPQCPVEFFRVVVLRTISFSLL